MRINDRFEAIILWDNTVIPCTLLEVTDEAILFRAVSEEQAYRYGSSISLGDIQKLRIFRAGQPVYVTVDEFLALLKEENEAPDSSASGTQTATGEPLEHALNPPSQSRGLPDLDSLPAAGAGRLPGFQLSSSFLDSLPHFVNATGIGLRLPSRAGEMVGIGEAELGSMADFIVNGGAAGLLLYRYDQLQSKKIELDLTTQRLIGALRGAASWQQRRQSILAANEAAQKAFAEHYKNVRADLKKEWGFTSPSETFAYQQFMIYLHTHGDLYSSRQRRFVLQWFGETALGAMRDLLANFNDWYYLAVYLTGADK